MSFSQGMMNLVSKTINDSNIDFNKFPASKVRQLAKKMESSKATANYIMQVASEPQATQVHLMRHQCIEISIQQISKKTKEIPYIRASHKQALPERQTKTKNATSAKKKL